MHRQIGVEVCYGENLAGCWNSPLRQQLGQVDVNALMKGWCRGMMRNWGIRALEWGGEGAYWREWVFGMGNLGCCIVHWCCQLLSEWVIGWDLKPEVCWSSLHDNQSLWEALASLVSVLPNQRFQNAFGPESVRVISFSIKKNEVKLHCCILWENGLEAQWIEWALRALTSKAIPQ
jgi:uncharacterized protein YecA (UPF0149 family)